MKRQIIGILLLLCLILSIKPRLLERSQASVLTAHSAETAAFRRMSLSQEGLKLLAETAAERNVSLSRLLTNGMLNGNFSLKKPEKWMFTDDAPYLKYKREEYEALLKAYQAVWADAQCFPIPQPAFYENTWGASRNYGGERVHEGCDLFGKEDIPDIYPVWSITDGVVEQVGWLPMGGYRIGVRSPSGGYFYYAHLSTYGGEFRIGDEVEAGELLGFMGSTGYGEEGTAGEFPVHLHLGIYIRTAAARELSVNPYWVLAYLEQFATSVKNT